MGSEPGQSAALGQRRKIPEARDGGRASSTGEPRRGNQGETCDEEAGQVRRGCRAMRWTGQAEPARRAAERNEPEQVSDPRLHEA